MPDLTDLIGNADAFPVLKRWTFLNHAGVSPLPKVVADAVRRFADASETGAYLEDNWFAEMERVRQATATFVNADRSEIALVKNTSEGISTVALGLDFQPGDRIVTADAEYPANVYPWMEACRRSGAELAFVPEETDADGRRAVPLAKLLAAVEQPRTKVLTLSHVEFGSGQRHDLATLGSACRSRGTFFNVDGIQSLGTTPVDVVAMKIDALSACGHKWMFGPPGAGFMYLRRDWHDRVRPLLVGNGTVAKWDAFTTRYDYTLRPDAGRYESGTPNLPGIYGFGAAVDLFNGVGLAPIAERIKRLTDRLVDGLELKGYAIVSPRANDAWSGIVSFTSPKHDHVDLAKSLLKGHKIELSVRENRLRASPHFYNTEEQIERLIAAVPGH
jgi:selenocysteine lyase/cysteine desulfurase